MEMFYKRFLLFGMQGYYPSGGFGDFIDSFDTLEEAKECWNNDTSRDVFEQRPPAQTEDWGEIVDLETGERHPLKGEK